MNKSKCPKRENPARMRRVLSLLVMWATVGAQLTTLVGGATAKTVFSDAKPVTFEKAVAKTNVAGALYFEENKGQLARQSDFVLRGAGYTLAVSAAEAVWYLPQARRGSAAAGKMEKVAACYDVYNRVSEQKAQAAVDKAAQSPLQLAKPEALVLAREPNAPEVPKEISLAEAEKNLQDCQKEILAADDSAAPQAEKSVKENEFSVLQMKLLGGSENAAISGVDEQTGKVNYYRGNDAKNWQTAVKTFAKVRAAQVYQGIDAVYYPNGKAVEYDFVVAPHADPNQIKLDFAGAKSVRIDAATGDLVIKIGDGEVRQHKPFIYQEANGGQVAVAGSFALAGKNSVKFKIGDYDQSKTLTIDPTVVFATYIGGSGDENFFQSFDSVGNVVGYGFVNSPGAPLGGSNPRSAAGGTDAYMYKLSPTGQLIFATYYGGSGAETGSISTIPQFANGLDSDLLISGLTNSTNLPTTAGAGQSAFGGVMDNFFARINISNGSLVFATYLGGSGSELTSSVNLNYLSAQTNAAYVYGQTPSTNFPMVNAAQSVYGGGTFDNYLVKLNLMTGAFVYSTYIGGSSGDDGVYFVAADAAENAYLAGRISPPGASSFPISPNAFQTAFGGGTSDNLYVKLAPAGALAASTYLGGSGEELSNPATAFPSANNSLKISSTGSTRSTNFPRVNAFQSGYGGGASDYFVVSLNENLTPIYSTTVGGTGEESINTLPVLNTTTNEYETIIYGRITAPDATPADNFPTVNAAQNGYGGGATDSVLAKLTANGTAAFSTYIGGAGEETFTNSVGFDTVGGFTLRDIIGYGRISAPDATPADNFTPTAGAAQTTFGGGADDAYFVRYDANNQLTGATYLGGGGSELSVNLSIDNTVSPTRFYLGGATASTDFTTANAAQSVYGGGAQDLYLARVNPNASLVYSTYLGGSGADTGSLLTNIYGFLNGSTIVSGTMTPGTAFPVTANAVQTAFGGGTTDNFLTKFSPTGTPEVSTYVGGTGNETGSLFPAFDAQRNFTVSATLTAPDASPADNFKPTVNAGQQTFGGGTTDGFAFKYGAGNQLVYATFIGGTGTESGGGGTYASGTYFQGSTTAIGYPVTANAAQNAYGGGATDGIVTRVNANDGSFIYSTYVGGSGGEFAGVIPDALGNMYISGTTDSPNLPIVNAFQNGLSTGGAFVNDGFYGKISTAGSYSFLSYLGGSSATFALEQTRFQFVRGRIYITGRISGPDATPADNFQPVNAAQSTYGGGAFDQVTILLDDRYVASLSANSISDFDGDGRADAAVFRSGTWYINPSGSTSRTTAPNADYGVQFGQAGDRLAPADYDGDGKTDLAVWRGGALGYFYILNSSNNTVRTEQFGTTGDNPAVVGDFDGDGKADPAVYREGAESFFYYRPSSQTGVDFAAIQWGTTGDKARRGDFDGDGKLDAAVFRASNNTWYIRQSSNNQARYEQWGAASDKFVAGDFDGDGKTDLTVFRDGIWYIKQSSNNAPLYRNWGAASDTLVAADYDGDGKTDVAVYRDGIYYILPTTSASPIYRTFGTGTDTPTAAAFVQ